MDEFFSHLTEIFKNVNEWLKFAEAKNAALLAVSAASITSIISTLLIAKAIPNSLINGLLLTTTLLCICALICSLSFVPKINLEHILWLQSRPSRKSRVVHKETDNFYFFGHLKKYNSTELLDALNQYYFNGCISKPYKKQYQDMARQITINAEIAFLKFRYFTFAICILIISIFIVPLSTLASLIIYHRL
jgi:hypothetical protein